MRNNQSGLKILATLVYSLCLNSYGDAVGGLVGGIMDQAFQAQGEQTKLQENTRVIDRKDNSDQSGNIGNAGQAAAIAAGSVMLGHGIPMSMSIDPIIHAAGLDLIAKGITELAQGAATGSSKDANYDQRDLLMRPDDQLGQQARTSSAPTLPSDVDQFLRDRGLNPDDIMRQAMRGDLNDFDSARRALGETADLSPEQRVAVKSLVDENLTTALSPMSANLKMDETQKNGATSDAASFSGLVTSGASALGSDMGTPKAGTQGGPARGLASGSGSFGSGGSGHDDEKVGATGPAWAENALAQFGIKGGTEFQMRAAAEMALGKLGIQTGRKGQNIFQKAKRNYNTFGRWRKSKRVAFTE